MTKRILTTLSVLIIILITGCGNNPTPPSGNQPPSASQSANQDTSVPDSSTLIGEDKAKAIALGKAGVSAEDVAFERIDLEREHGVLFYEIEFSKGRIEYEIDIHAEDGTILSFEKDDLD